jgi:hypothetical protein
MRNVLAKLEPKPGGRQSERNTKGDVKYLLRRLTEEERLLLFVLYGAVKRTKGIFSGQRGDLIAAGLSPSEMRAVSRFVLSAKIAVAENSG